MRIGEPLRLLPAQGKWDECRAQRQANADRIMRHIAALIPSEYRGEYAEGPI